MIKVQISADANDVDELLEAADKFKILAGYVTNVVDSGPRAHKGVYGFDGLACHAPSRAEHIREDDSGLCGEDATIVIDGTPFCHQCSLTMMEPEAGEKSEPDTETKPEAEVEPKAEPEVEAKPETGPTTKPELDSQNQPWDERIHLDNKEKLEKGNATQPAGSWKRKRGIEKKNPGLIAKVQAEHGETAVRARDAGEAEAAGLEVVSEPTLDDLEPTDKLLDLGFTLVGMVDDGGWTPAKLLNKGYAKLKPAPMPTPEPMPSPDDDVEVMPSPEDDEDTVPKSYPVFIGATNKMKMAKQITDADIAQVAKEMGLVDGNGTGCILLLSQPENASRIPDAEKRIRAKISGGQVDRSHGQA